MSLALAAGIGALGSLASTGLGIVSANSQSGKAFGRQLYAMQRQAELNYEYSQKSAENSPSWNRKGLEAAGYNPMLAVQNATSGANSSWTSPNSAPTDQATDAITNGVRNGTEMAQLAINQKQVEAQSDQAYAEADKAKVEKNAMLEKMPYISSREKSEIANLEKDSLLKESQIHNIDETTRFIEKNYELQRRLGEMGINLDYQSKIYGANKAFEASKYGSNLNLSGVKYSSNKSYNASTYRDTLNHPYWRILHRFYSSGKVSRPYGTYPDPWKY